MSDSMRRWFPHEDWLIVLLGSVLLALCTQFVRIKPAEEESVKVTAGKATAGKATVENLGKGKIAKLEQWVSDPTDAIYSKAGAKKSYNQGWPLAFTFCVVSVLVAPLAMYKGMAPRQYFTGVAVLFLLGTFAFVLAGQAVIKQYNFEYVLWALMLGLLISNTVGVPEFLRPMLIGDSLIKLGLVLFGAEVLFGKLIVLGVPGIFTSWLVTPVVLISTYWFGQKVLKMESPSLNMVISADMSVCGVSAAIATGAACRAKREEVSYAIGVSLLFTAIMMVVQPWFVLWSGMDKIVGAAWMGGTIDSTGAVAAAGAVLGKEAETVASTVKMIQNVLIGVIAFGVAAYWSARHGAEGADAKIGVGEIWKRFPKFVFGFIGASLVFSFLPQWFGLTASGVETLTKDLTTPLRMWLFCLAFVAFGLETNFRELSKYLREGKPLLLYLLGQAWSMLLSLAMASLMFGYLYADRIQELMKK